MNKNNNNVKMLYLTSLQSFHHLVLVCMDSTTKISILEN